jgi:hypothetical protein
MTRFAPSPPRPPVRPRLLRPDVVPLLVAPLPVPPKPAPVRPAIETDAKVAAETVDAAGSTAGGPAVAFAGAL